MCFNLKKLKKLSVKHGIQFEIKSSIQIHIKGAILVNYYPNSKKRTAYLAGTKHSYQDISYEEAFKLSITVPKLNGDKEKRKGSYKGAREKLLKKRPFCHWCDEPLTIETGTLEHIVPLALGGLNNPNNYTLACDSCNKNRGSSMPEILELGLNNG